MKDMAYDSPKVRCSRSSHAKDSPQHVPKSEVLRFMAQNTTPTRAKETRDLSCRLGGLWNPPHWPRNPEELTPLRAPRTNPESPIWLN